MNFHPFSGRVRPRGRPEIPRTRMKRSGGRNNDGRMVYFRFYRIHNDSIFLREKHTCMNLLSVSLSPLYFLSPNTHSRGHALYTSEQFTRIMLESGKNMLEYRTLIISFEICIINWIYSIIFSVIMYRSIHKVVWLCLRESKWLYSYYREWVSQKNK